MTKVEAMDKIRDEMAKVKNPAVETLGEWMTAWLGEHPEGGEKVLAEGKTLEGAYKAMEEEAKSHRVGNVGYVSPMKAAEIAAKYYSIEVDELKRVAAKNLLEQLEELAAQAPAPQEEPQADAESLTGALDLDALLGGL